MKKILNSGLVLTLLALASLSAHAQGVLYITDTSGKLGTVNLTNNAVTVLGTSGVVLKDIAFTSNGNLYGDTSTGLYTVNATTAATTLVGSFGGSGAGGISGLVGYGTKLIATSTVTQKLYVVNTAPFSIAALTGNLTYLSGGDLTFGANGAIYDILSDGELDKVTLSGSSFTTVQVGNTGNHGITGMATDSSGKVYAVSGTQIYVVDTNTAALTPFFNYAGHGLGTDTGAAFGASGLVVVPEPGNVALLLTGVAGLVLYQRRRNAVNLS